MNFNLDRPLVSVIVPAYNAEKSIRHTLLSVLSQTYRNIEVIVVDDGSQDRTAEIVETIAQGDHRVTLFKQQNAGVAAARNLAIQYSKGEYIAPIDADDIWYPEKLEKQVKCMLQAEPSVGLVYAWSVFIDEEGLLTGGYSSDSIEEHAYWNLLYGNFVGNASVPLIRRTCFEKVGLYNCELKKQGAQGCEDWCLYLRIADYYEFRVVPEFLVGYRQTNSNMSINYLSMAKSFDLVMAGVQQRYPEVDPTVYRKATSKLYRYLGGLSYCRGTHKTTIVLVGKSLLLDLADMKLNLESFFYLYKTLKVFILSLLKFLFQPITSLVWSDHEAWKKFRRISKEERRMLTLYNIEEIRTRAIAERDLFCQTEMKVSLPKLGKLASYSKLIAEDIVRTPKISN